MHLCPMYSFHILLDCWLCLYQEHKLKLQKSIFFFITTSKGTHFLIGYVATTFSKIVYFICVWFFLFAISYIMTCFRCILDQQIFHSPQFSLDKVWNLWKVWKITLFFFTCNATIFFCLPFISFISFSNPFWLVWMVPIQLICLLYSHIA